MQVIGYVQVKLPSQDTDNSCIMAQLVSRSHIKMQSTCDQMVQTDISACYCAVCAKKSLCKVEKLIPVEPLLPPPVKLP